jgi:hypothetical protein
MRKLSFILRTASLPSLPASAGAALQQPPARQPDITVTGEDRMVWRYVTRTATRMRRGRVCRKLSDWESDSDRSVRAANDPNATIDGAADTLEVLGSGPAGVRSDGALGPR